MEKTNNECIVNGEIIVLLRYLSNFLKILKMFIINCEINLILTWWK